uniref:Uncharacterized protein n=1 Tax=Naja naja TaxID=35670 RepID=A0A8C7E4W2_NAJNA
ARHHDHLPGQSRSISTDSLRSREAACNRGTMLAHLNPSASALPHGIWHSRSRGVNHRHEPHEAEVGDREVDLVRVKLEAAGKLVFRQVELTETLRGGDEAA